MAAVSGRIVQTAISAHQSKILRLLTSGKTCVVKLHSTLPLQGLGFTWTNNISAVQKSSRFETINLLCNASQSGTAVSSFEKLDFLKLQNGSDIRGVAVEGVQSEPINLTEPVTEAIASAFAGCRLKRACRCGNRGYTILVTVTRVRGFELGDFSHRELLSLFPVKGSMATDGNKTSDITSFLKSNSFLN